MAAWREPDALGQTDTEDRSQVQSVVICFHKRRIIHTVHDYLKFSSAFLFFLDTDTITQVCNYVSSLLRFPPMKAL